MRETTQKYYLGLDIGGTTVKGGIITDGGTVAARGTKATGRNVSAVVQSLGALSRELCAQVGIALKDLAGLGVGSAGTVFGAAGIVRSAANLGWTNVPLVELLQNETGVGNIKIANDANAAALGEALFGAGQRTGDSILLTLGTGVGGGLVLGGKIYEGREGGGAELGHMVIHAGGRQCGCGRKGCIEAYCSASALIRACEQAVQEHPDCKMRKAEKIEGRTAFDYAPQDKYAAQIVEAFIADLAVGIGNFMFIFRPAVILLGGGISAQGDNLLRPLLARLRQEMGVYFYPEVQIRIATLGNDAGFMGAAALTMPD